MGILDDAIREHLDLKRRQGADPTEVERLEREALGPVRRGPEGPEDEALGAEGEGPPYDEAGQEWSEPPTDEEFLPEPEPALADEAGLSLPDETEPSLANDREPSLADEEPELAPGPEQSGPALFDFEADPEPPPPFEDQPAGEPPLREPADAAPPPAADPASAPQGPEPAARPSELPDHLEEETAEYDVEAEHAEERRAPEDHPGAEGHEQQQAAGEDVLEETPEFLQDTPDHDRLWFEQRPPKDFDFEE